MYIYIYIYMCKAVIIIIISYFGYEHVHDILRSARPRRSRVNFPAIFPSTAGELQMTRAITRSAHIHFCPRNS